MCLRLILFSWKRWNMSSICYMDSRRFRCGGSMAAVSRWSTWAMSIATVDTLWLSAWYLIWVKMYCHWSSGLWTTWTACPKSEWLRDKGKRRGSEDKAYSYWLIDKLIRDITYNNKTNGWAPKMSLSTYTRWVPINVNWSIAAKYWRLILTVYPRLFSTWQLPSNQRTLFQRKSSSIWSILWALLVTHSSRNWYFPTSKSRERPTSLMMSLQPWLLHRLMHRFWLWSRKGKGESSV
jgi:hypothetical protein